VRLESPILEPNPGLGNVAQPRRLIDADARMRNLLFTLLHMAVMAATVVWVRAVMAENLLVVSHRAAQ
jgi:hypothetical protein